MWKNLHSLLDEQAKQDGFNDIFSSFGKECGTGPGRLSWIKQNMENMGWLPIMKNYSESENVHFQKVAVTLEERFFFENYTTKWEDIRKLTERDMVKINAAIDFMRNNPFKHHVVPPSLRKLVEEHLAQTEPSPKRQRIV